MEKTYALIRDTSDMYFCEDYYWAEWDDIVFLGGNEDFKASEIVKDILKLEDRYWEYEHDYWDNFTEFLNAYCPKKSNNKKFSKKEIGTIKKALESYDSFKYARDYRENLVVVVLSAVKGEKYACKTIRGCSQSDWNILYYPVRLSLKNLNDIEAIYFGTGTEIEIHEGEEDITDPREVEGYSYFTSTCDIEEIKKEIADITHTRPDNVILFKEELKQKYTLEYKIV